MRIIHIHKQYPPIVNITAVLSMLAVFIVQSIIDAYLYDKGYSYPDYNIFIPIAAYLILWKILYEYYKVKEVSLLKKMDKKPLWIRIVIVIFSILFIILVVHLWMFDGMKNIYQYVRYKL